MAFIQVFTASGIFTTPPNVRRILARIWAAGGGAAGGSSAITSGTAGSVGGDSWVKIDLNKSRGGIGGSVWTAQGQPPIPVLPPILREDDVQWGSVGHASSFNGSAQNGIGVKGGAFAPGQRGGAGIVNTGATGGGGAGVNPGFAGQHGEYSEYSIFVSPGELVPVTIGDGGLGGNAGGAGSFAGGAGGSGLVIIEWTYDARPVG